MLYWGDSAIKDEVSAAAYDAVHVEPDSQKPF
jgi:hypothetical protein